jgi:hypothetical protein
MTSRTWLPGAATVCCVAALVACAAPARQEQASPQLRLSPASLGATLALQQLLTVTARGQTQRLEVLLEADPQAVRLAVVSMGQTAARLEWDGVKLTQSRAKWWPEAVTAERILDDLQLMLWPAPAVSAALPAGWRLAASADQRVLSRDGQVVATVRYEGPGVSELVHLAEGYRLRVESRALEVTQ